MQIFNVLLITHIICGGMSLLLGLAILLIKKGNKRHKLMGNIYFYAMLIAASVSLPMAILHPNYFLFIVATVTAKDGSNVSNYGFYDKKGRY